MYESNALYKELEILNPSGARSLPWERDSPPPVISAATVGFEFDVNYGASASEPPPPNANYGIEGEEITTHRSSTDGFRLKGDGNRIEVATKPFFIDAAGKKDMLDTVKKIQTLTGEFESLCSKAPLHPGTDTDTYKKTNKVGKKVVGRPQCIKHPLLKSGIKCIFPLEGQYTYYRQQLCGVAGSPQATIAVPLAKIEALVKKIKASEDLPKSKFPLSGNSRFRLGLRSDALYKALDAVNRSRRYHISNKTKLSDGTVISEKNYTPALQGLLILMVSYLITSELKPDERDYEVFAKAYLPLNVKNHFYFLLDDLNDAEKRVFKERYFDGAKQFNIFKLAKADADLAFAKSRKLFPAKAEDGKLYFKTQPTWFDFVSKTFTKTPLLRDVEPVEISPKHKKGDETLFDPISRTIPYVAGSRRAIVEMRRLGTRMVSKDEWENLMLTIFKLAEDLNK